MLLGTLDGKTSNLVRYGVRIVGIRPLQSSEGNEAALGIQCSTLASHLLVCQHVFVGRIATYKCTQRLIKLDKATVFVFIIFTSPVIHVYSNESVLSLQVEVQRA